MTLKSGYSLDLSVKVKLKRVPQWQKSEDTMKSVCGSSAYLASSCPYSASLREAKMDIRLCATAVSTQDLSIHHIACAMAAPNVLVHTPCGQVSCVLHALGVAPGGGSHRSGVRVPTMMGTSSKSFPLQAQHVMFQCRCQGYRSLGAPHAHCSGGGSACGLTLPHHMHQEAHLQF